jgi:hypothetical protein
MLILNSMRNSAAKMAITHGSKKNGRLFLKINFSKYESQRALDTLIEKDFQEAFQKWRIRWDRCPTCGRELLRGLRRPIGLMMSFTIFTASVRKILDTTLYTSLVTATW